MRLQDYPPQTSSLGGPSTGSFDQTMGDGGARNDYLSRVYRHIDPYRDYPAAARAARQHGRVVTRVTINRAGELLDIRLDHSSGWPLIDNAEMAAIRRAMPFPPVPDGMRGDPVVLVLPMNY
jgi:protein TonB